MVFTVNNQQWEIVYCRPNDDNLRRSDGSITFAVTDNNTKCIYMNKNLRGYMFDKVLCHELTHVYAFEFEYNVDVETEEIIADFLSLFGRQIVYLLDDLMEILKRAIWCPLT